MSVHLHINSDTGKLTKAAGEQLNSQLKLNKDKDILIVLSGGSALTLLNYIDTGLLHRTALSQF